MHLNHSTSVPATLSVVFTVVFFASSTLGIVAQESPDSRPRVFRAGAFAIDITPTEFPVESAGNMTPNVATFASDPLHARCLVLDDGTTTIAFAICDHCMIPRELIDRIGQIAQGRCGIPADHVLVSATHTHTGVTLTPVFQSKVEAEYSEWFVEQVAEGIQQAHSRLAAAKIGWVVGNNPNQVFNRRWYMREGVEITDPFDVGKDRVRMNPPPASSQLLKPSGPIDPEIPVISLVSPDNVPIALLANYALHYVGGVPGKALSADYFGEFARQYMSLQSIDPKTGFVAMMTNGTSGNINNINFFDGAPGQQPLEQIRLVGRDLAESVADAMRRIEYQDWVAIRSVSEEVTMRVRKPSGDELSRAKTFVDEAGEKPLRKMRDIYAQESIDLAAYPDEVTARIQAIRIGELGIVSSPCETFVETGLAIKQQSPLRTTFTIELANGYNGYLPTAEHHALGGYETWRAKSSYLAEDSEALVRQAQLRLLESLSD